MQTFCSSDYHAPIVNSSSLLTSSGNNTTNGSGCLAKFNDIDALNSSYAPYNNWSNGYQYAACGTTAAANVQPNTQTQYPAPPHATPTMLIYPHVYSTVNQNQIHLHLHGTEKIEQYLQSSDNNSLTVNSTRNANIDIDGSDTSANLSGIIESDETEQHRQQHQTNNRDDQEVGDPSSVWRPY